MDHLGPLLGLDDGLEEEDETVEAHRDREEWYQQPEELVLPSLAPVAYATAGANTAGGHVSIGGSRTFGEAGGWSSSTSDPHECDTSSGETFSDPGLDLDPMFIPPISEHGGTVLLTRDMLHLHNEGQDL